MQRYREILLIAVLVIVVLSAAIVYYFFIFIPSQASSTEVQQQQANQALQSGRQLVNSGEGASAIPWLQQAVSQAVGNTQKSRAELNLASAYVQAGMIQQGIDLWKQVSLDQEYPLGYRATAADSVIQYYTSTPDLNLALNTIFVDTTWGDFITGNSSNVSGVNVAVRNALLWIEMLDPTNTPPDVPYRLAAWYGQDLASASTSTKAQDVVQIKKYLQLGDTAYGGALAANVAAMQQDPTSVPPYPSSVFGGFLTLKARALGALYTAQTPGVTLQNVDLVFNQAITLLEKPTASSVASTTALYPRFNYAVFLVSANPVTQKQQILSTLAPIDAKMQPQNTFYTSFLGQYGTNSAFHDSSTWNSIVALAKVDPNFKALLITLGWSTSNFQ